MGDTIPVANTNRHDTRANGWCFYQAALEAAGAKKVTDVDSLELAKELVAVLQNDNNGKIITPSSVPLKDAIVDDADTYNLTDLMVPKNADDLKEGPVQWARGPTMSWAYTIQYHRVINIYEQVGDNYVLRSSSTGMQNSDNTVIDATSGGGPINLLYSATTNGAGHKSGHFDWFSIKAPGVTDTKRTNAKSRGLSGDGSGTPVKPTKTLLEKMGSASKSMRNAIRSARRQIKSEMKDEVIVAATRVRLEPEGFSFTRHPEVDSIRQYFNGGDITEGKRVFNMMFSSSSDFNPKNPLPPCGAIEKEILLKGLQTRLKSLRSEIVVARAKTGDSVDTREMLDHIQRLVSLINGIEAADHCQDYDSIGNIVKKGDKNLINEERIKSLLRKFAFLVLQGIAPISGEKNKWKDSSKWAKEFVKGLEKNPISPEDWDDYTRDYSAAGFTVPPIIVRALGDPELVKDLSVAAQMELLDKVLAAIRKALPDDTEFNESFPPFNLYKIPSDTIMEVLQWVLKKYMDCAAEHQKTKDLLTTAREAARSADNALTDARTRLAAAAAAAAAAAGAGGDAAAAAALAAAAAANADKEAAVAEATARIAELRRQLGEANDAAAAAAAAAAGVKAALDAQIAAKNTEIGKLKTDLQVATESIRQFQAQVADLNQQIARLTQQIAAKGSGEADRAAMAALRDQLDNITRERDAAQAALAKAQADLATARADLEAANARAAASDADAKKARDTYGALIAKLALLSEAIVNGTEIPDLIDIPALDAIKSKITELRTYLDTSKSLCLFAYYVNFFITYIFSQRGGGDAYNYINTVIDGLPPDNTYHQLLEYYSGKLQAAEEGYEIPVIRVNTEVIRLFRNRFEDYLRDRNDSYIMYLAMFIVTSQKYLISDKDVLDSLGCKLPAAILRPDIVFDRAAPRVVPAAAPPPRSVAPPPAARAAAAALQPPAPAAPTLTPAPATRFTAPTLTPAPFAPPAPAPFAPPAPPRSATPPPASPPPTRSVTPAPPLVLPKATGITYAADAITEEQAEDALNVIRDIIKAAKLGRITRDNRTDYLKYKHILDSYCSYGDKKHPLDRYPEPNRAICYQYATTKSYKLPSER